MTARKDGGATERDENYERVMEAMGHGPLLVGDIRVAGEVAAIGFWRDVTTGVITSWCGCRWGDGVAPAGSPVFLCARHR